MRTATARGATLAGAKRRETRGSRRLEATYGPVVAVGFGESVGVDSGGLVGPAVGGHGARQTLAARWVSEKACDRVPKRDTCGAPAPRELSANG
jgi:hypothetical protein